mgnify:CR=1 FL=1
MNNYYVAGRNTTDGNGFTLPRGIDDDRFYIVWTKIQDYVRSYDRLILVASYHIRLDGS